MVGREISHYRILSRLGGGGMGEIFEAEDTKLGRRVALKFLPAHLSGDTTALERLEREARAASLLNHPNICVIHDIDQADGQRFIAMELLEGHSLDRNAGEALPLERVLDIGIQAADALDAAHVQGVIHRDIKPANLFLTSRGQLKVLDFGLAKRTEARSSLRSIAATAGGPASEHLTSPGSALGTVAYMSPEQARGEELDGRTDLFSLGAVLYELATGKHPFPGTTTAVVFDAIMNRAPVPPTQLNPALPAEFEDIVDRALDKDLEIRYQSAADLRADLKRLKRDADSGKSAVQPAASGAAARKLSAPAAPSSSVLVAAAKQHKLGTGMAALLVMLVVAAAVFGVYSLLHGPHPAPFQGAAPSRVTDNGRIGLVSISPDAKYMVSVRQDADAGSSLWLRHLPTNSDTQVVAPTQTFFRGVQFSPDGNYIYFVRSTNTEATRKGVFRAPVLGGAPVLLMDDVDTDISFSPDGKRFAYARFNVPELGKFFLHTVAIDGSDDKLITSGPYGSMQNIAWSPDGKTIVFEDTRRQGTQVSALMAVPAAGGDQRKIASWNDRFVLQPTWYFDGNGLLVLFNQTGFSGLQIGYVNYPSGEFHRITNDTNNYQRIAVSADGQTLAAISSDFGANAYTVPGDKPSAALTRVTPRGRWSNFGWLSNGQIVYAERLHIYRRSLDPNAEAVTLRADDQRPSFSPAGCGDGIVFASNDTTGDHRSNVWRMDINGGNLQRLSAGQSDNNPVCSPDARWLFYTDTIGQRLMRMPAAGGEAREVFAGQIGSYDISPDGRHLLVSYFGGQPLGRRVSEFNTETLEREREFANPDPRVNNAAIRFMPGGTAMAYVTFENGMNTISAVDLESRTQRQLASIPAEAPPLFVTDFRWSPDGKTLAIVRGRGDSDVVLFKEPGK